jgi:hypothetical protein
VAQTCRRIVGVHLSAVAFRPRGVVQSTMWAPTQISRKRALLTVGIRCTYARAWIQVKRYYNLAVDTAEKSALTAMLHTC